MSMRNALDNLAVLLKENVFHSLHVLLGSKLEMHFPFTGRHV